MSDKVIVENVNHPGQATRVDAAKYHAMRKAVLRVTPKGEPGLTAAEILVAAKPHLPEALFPGGSTSGWWAKTVQLDLEAKGILRRHATKPLTFSAT